MNWKEDKKKSGQKSLWVFLKRSLWAGIATLFPLFLTAYAVIVIIRFADNFAGEHINSFLTRHYYFSMPGIGVLVLLLILIIVGLFSRMFLGRWLTSFIDKILKKTPLIANIYPSAKELSDFLFNSEEKNKFQKVVSVEFPQKDTYSIGFITNENVQQFDSSAQDDLVAVFIPLAPTPVTGFIILLSKERVKELEMSVDKALKFIISGGVVLAKEDGPKGKKSPDRQSRTEKNGEEHAEPSDQ